MGQKDLSNCITDDSETGDNDGLVAEISRLFVFFHMIFPHFYAFINIYEYANYMLIR